MAQQEDVVLEHRLVGLTLHEREPGREWDVVALHEGQTEAVVVGSAFRAESGRLVFQSRGSWGQYATTLRRVADLLDAKERGLGLKAGLRTPILTMQEAPPRLDPWPIASNRSAETP